MFVCRCVPLASMLPRPSAQPASSAHPAPSATTGAHPPAGRASPARSPPRQAHCSATFASKGLQDSFSRSICCKKVSTVQRHAALISFMCQALSNWHSQGCSRRQYGGQFLWLRQCHCWTLPRLAPLTACAATVCRDGSTTRTEGATDCEVVVAGGFAAVDDVWGTADVAILLSFGLLLDGTSLESVSRCADCSLCWWQC